MFGCSTGFRHFILFQEWQHMFGPPPLPDAQKKEFETAEILQPELAPPPESRPPSGNFPARDVPGRYFGHEDDISR